MLQHHLTIYSRLKSIIIHRSLYFFMPRVSSWSHLAFSSANTNSKGAQIIKSLHVESTSSGHARNSRAPTCRAFIQIARTRSISVCPSLPTTWKPSITTRSVRCSASAIAHYSLFIFWDFSPPHRGFFLTRLAQNSSRHVKYIFFKRSPLSWNLLSWEVFEFDVNLGISSRSN